MILKLQKNERWVIERIWDVTSPVSETGPRVRAVFEVRVDVLVTKDGEIEEAQAGAEEPGRRHHHQWYLQYAKCGQQQVGRSGF